MGLIENHYIENACEELGYYNGDLISLMDGFTSHFSEKGDWLKLCESVNVTNILTTEKIFFVHNEPIIVFVKSNSTENLHRIYNRVWCMARPRILFLETETGLYILDLATKPLKTDEELVDSSLAIIKNVVEIKTNLNNFRRELIESGEIFDNNTFSNIEDRADRALIRDLKSVRENLYNAGLAGKNLKYAHSIIVKSIFIRYLEDRGILTPQYFYEIAKSRKEWQQILTDESDDIFIEPEMATLMYPKVLTSKSFTNQLFKQIAIDFNGDIFPTDDKEEEVISENHLRILSNFLLGNTQNQLFFWAYRFDIIPIELISNIYEEFYHYNNRELEAIKVGKKPDSKGTYYTPAPLVEFLLRRTLSENILEKKPLVMDPACGSGIFLVEAFKRIVRYRSFKKKNKAVSYTELLVILKNQIAGIELNEEAVKITAFSLYLAFLNYLTPPDILLQIKKGKRLPHLIYSASKITGEDYFDILLHSNAFRTELAGEGTSLEKFKSNRADVIVGNPPWGSPAADDSEGRIALNIAMKWCDTRSYPTSDMELSQAFLWRAYELLKDGGIAGMLVSSGILLKQSLKSNIFKQTWINTVTLKEVGNFVHVRDVFFNGAISPFLSVIFAKAEPLTNSFIDYWTARRTKIIENTKSVILDKTDFKFLSYVDTRASDLWKIFYFGNHRDLALINKLRLNPLLQKFEFIPENGQPRRQGFIEGNKKLNADWLKDYKELPADCFKDRYTTINFSKVLIPVPDQVKERGPQHLYDGKRLLIGKVSQKTEPKGQLIARLEAEKFCFRNTINCIKLKDEFSEQYEIILGILWSSLARYYFFMTASKWGVWHDQVYADEILKLPIVLSNDEKLIKEIKDVVSKLRDQKFDIISTGNTRYHDLFSINTQKKHNQTASDLEKDLDKLVFKLYHLTPADIQLINDRCYLDIDFFYNDSKSIAVSKVKGILHQSGTLNDVLVDSNKLLLSSYLQTFIGSWEKEIEENQHLHYRLVHSTRSSLIAAIFEITEKNVETLHYPSVDDEWEKTLADLDRELTTKYSSNIYIDGIARIITNDKIIIIKRNENRLWSSTAAREDVDATILQAMVKQEANA